MIFKNGYKITQEFGANPNYYKQFGLNGHEGLDLIPKDNDWNMYNPSNGGIVVKDVDDERFGGNYGNFFTIWYPKHKKALLFAHNFENYVDLNEKVDKGELLAKMGSTGNVTGPHVHIGCVETDEHGNRVNRNNGYMGYIDPLPFLLSLDKDETPKSDCESKIDGIRTSRNEWRDLAKKREDLLKDRAKDIAEYLETITSREQVIHSLNQKVVELEREVKTLMAKTTVVSKEWYKSKTFWAGIIEILIGILTALQGELEVGATLTVSGIAKVALRVVTRETLKF